MRVLLIAAALLCSPIALADDAPESDPCQQVKELEQSITDLAEQIAWLLEEAKPVCKHKALAKECARRRVEIDGMMRSLKELNAERRQAVAACDAKKP